MQKIPPDIDLMVRNAVETEVSKRVSGYGLTLKSVGAVLVFLFAMLGLRTCSDIETNVNAAYVSELKSRLDDEDASSEISRYSRQLKELYGRGFLDSSMLRAHLISQRYDATPYSFISFEDLKKLMIIIQSESTSEEDFRLALGALKVVLPSIEEKARSELLSGLAQLIVKAKDKQPIPSWRRVELIQILTEANFQDASEGIRAVLGDPGSYGDLQLNAIYYVMRIRDKEALDFLVKLTSSEDMQISEAALAAIATINPDNSLIKGEIDMLNQDSSFDDIGRAVFIAAAVAKEMNYTRRANAQKTKWAESELQLIKKVIKAAIASGAELHSLNMRFREVSAEILDVQYSENFMLQSSGGVVSNRSISSDLLVGETSNLITDILAESLKNNSLLPALRFFGATADLRHPAAVGMHMFPGNTIETASHGVIGSEQAVVAVIVCDRDAKANKIYVGWRDIFGFIRDDEVSSLGENLRMELILTPI